MDFFDICTKELKGGGYEVYPDFLVGRSKDLMIRGGAFYAIWDEEAGLWSTDEYEARRLIDEKLMAEVDRLNKTGDIHYQIRSARSFRSQVWAQFRRYMSQISDNSTPLDSKLTFANTEVKKRDYVSKRLPYPLEAGDYSAWDELVGTLYSTEEREKIEWAIGAIVSGDSKKIQKFLVFYGPAGTGKSTVLNIVNSLFDGYVTTFEAKALGSNNGQFATEVFKNNPLVGIQHDGDLSRIEDNTRLNSIISHEEMTMNEKFKAAYSAKVQAFIMMGTNLPVKISDSKSGIIRRLIDVHPTGVKIPPSRYNALMSQVDFELGAIASHCLSVYQQLGKNYYNAYRPVEMMYQTDVFFNFIEAYFDVFKAEKYLTLRRAYSMYKEFCAETGVDKVLAMYKAREELRSYFDEYHEKITVDGEILRSVYSGFNAAKFKQATELPATQFSLVVDNEVSLLDELYSDQPAQLSNEHGVPSRAWAKTLTKLRDIDTSQEHFLQVPTQHIVVDFDLKDERGEKSLARNLEAASSWPPTYAELSKSGNGVHLHYIYDGDVSELASAYSEGIEVKTLLGDASLRRKLTFCNDIPIAHLNSGLPIKEKSVLSDKTIKSEKGLRDLIARNLHKDIHPNTVSSVSFIKHILDEAYTSGMTYDVTDLRSKILAFAANSTNQALVCIKAVQQMKFSGGGSEKDSRVESPQDFFGEDPATVKPKDERLAFFDVEVYYNLFVVCWKFSGEASMVRMINPSPQDIENLFMLKLVGFNNRRYDNHILYARYNGYNNAQLYVLSQRLIDNDRNATFAGAYNVSYADIYDFSSKKQSLKKFEIELGLPHVEMDLPWDQPVPDNMIDKVVEYCCNDVEATEATFNARKQDFVARQILADLSGLSVNDTTAKHTARIIFGNDPRPQTSFKYTNLAEEFPGYSFDAGKSSYFDEKINEGGYVYAEPGYYENVALLDVASMHPTSIENLNFFGDEYTPKFSDLKKARVAIKRKDYDSARKMLDGKLAPYLSDPAEADALSYALKIVINIVYGLTSAKFDNPFRHPMNKDNVVAKRGALFMIELRKAVQAQGFTVAHIKTDSIKIPNATPEIIKFVEDFGAKYGYEFEHEATYDKFCLVNDAVYVAGQNRSPRGDDYIDSDFRTNWKWTAVGAQFQHPYVFKSLFSGEDIVLDDYAETKQVSKGAIYLDFEHDRPEPTVEGMHFVGKIGRFIPVVENSGGGVLYRVNEGKPYAVTGTKGYLWVEADKLKVLEKQDSINMAYFEGLTDAAKKTLAKFGMEL